MSFNSPYNFVPLASNVHIPEQQEISQDYPLEEGYSGVIELELKNLNELILGDSNSENLDYQPFFSANNQQPAISGTSIKGMIRNLLEIATGGFIEMDQNQFSQRDLTNAQNDYMRALRAKKSGWLFWDSTSESWYIAPTKEAFKTIRHTANITRNTENANTDVKDILEKLLSSITPPIHKIEGAVERYKEILKAKPTAKKIGTAVEVLKGQYLIVTNQLEDSNKSREFLFSEPTRNKAKIVNSEVLRRFEYVMDKSQTKLGSNHWQYLKSFANEGIPVFYLQNAQNEISAFGLASLFRLPYEKTLFDLLPLDHKNRLSKSKADFVGLLFGEIPTADQTSISRKGRVSFGLATTDSVGTYQTHRVVLSNPKPTYYPAYLKQPQNDLNNYNSASQISGFKKYLPHQTIKKSQIPLNEDGSENLDEEVSKQVQVLTSKHTFKSRIRVHNVNAYELGALIWACTLGETGDSQQYQHLIGMGKPLGYGKIKVNVTSLDVKPNKVCQSMPQTQANFLNEFYAYLAINDLLNENFATLKASHRNGVVENQRLNYLVLNPTERKDDFLDMRKAQKSLPRLEIEPEKSRIKDIRIELSELIEARNQQQKALRLKLEEERIAKERQAQEQKNLEIAAKRQANRSAFEVLFEDVLNKEINKEALTTLIADPSLYNTLSEEHRIQLVNKIEANNWFKGLKKKRSKWRGQLPDLFKK